jgi:hypothetical protein
MYKVTMTLAGGLCAMNEDILAGQIQYTSESRTRFGFWIRSYAGPDHLIARPFESRTQKSGFQNITSLDCFINRKGS